MVSRDSKIRNSTSCLFFCWLLLGLVVWPKLGDSFVCQNPWGVCVSFSWTNAWLCIYDLFVWSNFNFLHSSQWITLPTQSYLVLYSFCANSLHSFIIWLMVSSLSPHNLQLLFCCVYLFILWYDWSLWRCFVLLFFSLCFPFLPTSTFSRVRYHLLIT